ncbi:OmpA family protein [Mucilaginibacter corticis]|uniref:OmpA family protein n=1 Tax=Mucilaginibacter corticis TaxID=2597670 RepID=A0A556MH80_9SPHI|nr:OmpA family protein [Mucilaginibacter corticis]TSJ39276.1 OmpA family protein [Mucilaginibacter corticis]
MKKVAFIILLATTFLARVSAQEQPTKQKLADNLFERYEYFKSLNIYLELANKSQPKYAVVERIADCYRLMNDYENAEIWYQKAIAYPEGAIIDHFYYAEVLLRNKKFADAREQYKVYYQVENGDQLPFKLATCDSAEKWINNPSTAFTVINEQKYNTKYSDWGLNYEGPSGFVFTSDRILPKQKNDIYNRNGNGYFKMYHTTGENGVGLLELKTEKNPIFEAVYNVGPMVLTNSGDTAYITITTTLPKGKLSVDAKVSGGTESLYTRRLQLIVATKTAGKWTNFKSFPYNNVNEYSVGHATLSKDGKVIYFTSDMPGGQGKTDIWYCIKQPDGTWGQPVNCGNVINTKEDEFFPTLNDNNTLYFSSNGLPGMGGLDIFKTKGEKSTWIKPVNLKTPVNSTSDDFYFVTRDSLSGYFSSNREGGSGSDDVYSFGYKPPPETKHPAKNALTAKNGQVSSSSKNGNGKPTLANRSAQEPLARIVSLNKGDGFIIKNIYYNLDKSNIRPDAAVELDELVQILKQRPTIRLEVGAHTDSRAPAAYNMALSIRRAHSAVDYLVARGIASDRLVPRGYGETRLLNNCTKGRFCTEAEHQLNRRTELRILSE